MYVSPNFKTKKALKEALVAGRSVEVYSPGPFPCPRDGSTTIEGPHYPEPHKWYASVELREGRIVKLDGKPIVVQPKPVPQPPVPRPEIEYEGERWDGLS